MSLHASASLVVVLLLAVVLVVLILALILVLIVLLVILILIVLAVLAILRIVGVVELIVVHVLLPPVGYRLQEVVWQIHIKNIQKNQKYFSTINLPSP